jgi:hypothetical protein
MYQDNREVMHPLFIRVFFHSFVRSSSAGRSTVRQGLRHGAAHPTAGPRPSGAARAALWPSSSRPPPVTTSTAAAASAAAAAEALGCTAGAQNPWHSLGMNLHLPLLHARQDLECGNRIRNFRAAGQLKIVHTGPAIKQMCALSTQSG